MSLMAANCFHMAGMAKVQRSDIAVMAIAALLAPTIFRIDLALPRGVAAAAPYILVIMAGWWLSRPCYIWIFAAVTSAFTVADFFLSAPGGVLSAVVTNRSICIVAIWITAALVIKAKSAELLLRAAKRTLEQ